jgi:hypothetical protein
MLGSDEALIAVVGAALFLMTCWFARRSGSLIVVRVLNNDKKIEEIMQKTERFKLRGSIELIKLE